ncbi:MAG: adenylyl-sulfate reductase subunit alpha [Candidatus Anammoxibacter sp.]
MDNINITRLKTDVLIVGGGAAGCFAAAELKSISPDCNCIIMEKAQIDRSGCLAMGINAINAYINPGETPESFVEYIKNEFMGVIREDLVYSIAEGVNDVVKKVEGWGLPIEKDRNGYYKMRGKRSIRIHGERLKPILAEEALRSGATILNRVVATNFIFDGKKVTGAFGYGVRDNAFYVIEAKAVLVTTGGAARIYKPNNEGSSRNMMWYCPWNVGTGYAMGIRIGAEMTSFENRFVALRVKDVNAPTGTLAIGVGAKQVNAIGESYLSERYECFGGRKCITPYRLYATILEDKAGRGPCYLDISHLDDDERRKLREDFLSMNPSIVLLWAAEGLGKKLSCVEICGTEPFVEGGHSQAGYWIDVHRRTTIKGLYAAGDVTGGSPKKYASGAWVEARIAVKTILEDIKDFDYCAADESCVKKEMERVTAPFGNHNHDSLHPREMEERLQKIMDEYAGGISTNYELNEKRLKLARDFLVELVGHVKQLDARDSQELVSGLELIDRLEVAQVLVEHLYYRRETRWPCYQTRIDFPERDDKYWLKHINSVRDTESGKIKIIKRDLMK